MFFVSKITGTSINPLKPMVMKRVLSLIAAASAFFAVTAEAQDEQYYMNSWYNCEMGGNQTVWTIKKYKEGISWMNPMVAERGKITFSDGCIEIDCNKMQMHFPVSEYKRVSDKVFAVTRQGEDDYFDYIEVVEGEGREKGQYRFMLALLGPDDVLMNTHVFICEPNKYSTGKTEQEARGGKTKSVGLPIQVRRR